MPEELNNIPEKINIKKWVITSLCLIAGWSFLEYYYELSFIFTSSFLWIPIIICGIYYNVPDKYLIPTTYLLAITHDIIISLIGSKLGVARGFLGLNFFIFIFISFFIFSIRMIKNEKEENKEARREIIIKKLLWLIFALIIIIILYCIYFLVMFE